VKEPVDHILRPQLPWRIGREGAITECGYDASKVKTLTRDEFTARFKDLGQKRMMMFTCMTCYDTARRHGTWEDDPRGAIDREIDWEIRFWRSNGRGDRLKHELIAIAALIEAHKDEFFDLIDADAKRREWLEKKAAHSAKPKAASGNSLL
jgi:hypothetical protein